MPRFSETLTEHFLDPHNRGPLPEHTHLGVVGAPGQGPFFVLSLRIEQGVVRRATFDCNACGATIASGSVMTEWLTGRPVTQCRELTHSRLVELLDGLPPDKFHCAATAIDALHRALSQEVVSVPNP